MRFCRACLVALLFALSAILSLTAAHAASLDEALTHFTADDFSETATGIKDVVASGSPRASVCVVTTVETIAVPIAPPIVVALAKHPIVDSFDLSSLQTLTSAAAALDEELV